MTMLWPRKMPFGPSSLTPKSARPLARRLVSAAVADAVVDCFTWNRYLVAMRSLPTVAA